MTKEENYDTIKNDKKDVSLQFDPKDYIQYLDGMDVTEAEAEAMLSALWQIMVQFVDMGFEIDATPNKTAARTQICKKETDRDRK